MNNFDQELYMKRLRSLGVVDFPMSGLLTPEALRIIRQRPLEKVSPYRAGEFGFIFDEEGNKV